MFESLDKEQETLIEKAKKNLKKLSQSQREVLLKKIQKPDIFKHTHDVKESELEKIKIGIISDTQINSIFCLEELIKKLYNWFVAEKVDFVVHAGDFTDGDYSKIRPDHRFQTYVQGFNNVVKYVAEVYPKTNLYTLFIMGNHDYTYFRENKADICEAISTIRKDLIYLGTVKDFPEKLKSIVEPTKWQDLHHFFTYWEANLLIGKQKKCKLTIAHPVRGGYTLTYGVQKKSEIYEDFKKPHILITGDEHKQGLLFIRGMHIIQGGTTQYQSLFMRSKDLMANIGGAIISLKIRYDGTIDSLNYKESPKEWNSEALEKAIEKQKKYISKLAEI